MKRYHPIQQSPPSPPFYIPNEYATYSLDASKQRYSSLGIIMKFDSSDGSQSILIKKFTKPFDSLDMGKEVLRELSALRAVKHEHIVRFVSSYKVEEGIYNTESIYCITYYCGEPLSKVIERGQYSMKNVKKWTREILLASQYLQCMRIMHGNLNPDNICIDDSNKVILADIGFASNQESISEGHTFSKSFEQKQNILETKLNNNFMDPQPPCYQPIENLLSVIICGDDLKARVDTWSISAILCVMISGRSLFGGENVWSILKTQMECCGPIEERMLEKMMSNADRTSISKHSLLSERKDFVNILRELIRPARGITEQDICDSNQQSLRDFIDQTLQFNPEKRLTTQQALAHPFVKILQPWETQLPEEEGEALKALRQQIWNEIKSTSLLLSDERNGKKRMEICASESNPLK